MIADNAKPLIARLTRCIDGRPGRALLAGQAAVKARVAAARARQVPSFARTSAAIGTAHRLDLTAVASDPSAPSPAVSAAGTGGRDAATVGSYATGVR